MPDDEGPPPVNGTDSAAGSLPPDDAPAWVPIEEDAGGAPPFAEATAAEAPRRPSPGGRPAPPSGDYGPKAGDARTGPLPMHPMNLSDVLDGAFKLYKANIRTVLTVSAVFVVPVQVLAAYLQRDLFEDLFDFSSTGLAESDDGSFGGSLGASLVGLIVLPLIAGAVSRVVASSYLGEELSAGDALRQVGRRWWVFLVAWLLVHIVEAVAFVACILPGFLAMALFVPVAPTIAVDGLGPVKAMRRSARLVRPRLWPVLGIALVSGILASVVGAGLGFLPQMAAFLVGGDWAWVLFAMGSVLSGVATTPFVAIVATLVYFDGRIRQEGFDLQIMAADLARGATSP